MKKLLILLFSVVVVNAEIYYAKVEPLERYTIKSIVSGEVLFANEAIEGKNTKDTKVIQIDDLMQREDLKTAKSNLKILNERLTIAQSQLESLEKIAKLREERFNKIMNMKSQSEVEKENSQIASISATNQLLSMKDGILAMKSQKESLENNIAHLKDTISNKLFVENKRVIQKLYVKAGDVVNPSQPLYEALDVSKAKLTIFLSREDAKNPKNIYLDGVKSDVKFSKIYSVADEKHLSSYKAEIIIPAPKQFSSLVKVELKN